MTQRPARRSDRITSDGLRPCATPHGQLCPDFAGGVDVMGQQRPQASAAKFEKLAYSITSSARAITEAGTVIPSALAVSRLTLRWKRVGCSNGRSAGLAPFKAIDQIRRAIVNFIQVGAKGRQTAFAYIVCPFVGGRQRTFSSKFVDPSAIEASECIRDHENCVRWIAHHACESFVRNFRLTHAEWLHAEPQSSAPRQRLPGSAASCPDRLRSRASPRCAT